jgi:hypothetical protein
VNRQSSGEIASRDEQAHAASFVRALQSPRLDLWALAAILVIAAISMATALTRFSTEYDEGVYWQSLRAMAHGHALYSSVFGSQPPGFLLGVYPGYLLLGQSIVAGRVVIALYALAGIVAIYVIGRALGGRWVGVLAAGLLALNPRHLQEATTLHAEIPSLTLSLNASADLALSTDCGCRSGARTCDHDEAAGGRGARSRRLAHRLATCLGDCEEPR